MNKLTWTTTNRILIGEHYIPCVENITDQANQKSGIRRDSKFKLVIKTILWPIVKLRDDLFIDGFIEWAIGRWIKELSNDNTTFLEVGCVIGSQKTGQKLKVRK